MWVRGKGGSIEVVVGIGMIVGKIVVDDEEPESESGFEIELGSWVEGTAVEIEVEIALTLC